MKGLQQFNDAMERLEKLLVMVGLVVLTATVFLAAVLRFFDIDMSFSTDLAQLAFAWTSMIGASYAVRSRSHIGMTFLREKFSLKIQYGIQVVCGVLILIFLVLLVIYGLDLVFTNWDRKYNTLGITYSVATASCPVGALLMISGTLHHLFGDIKRFKEA